MRKANLEQRDHAWFAMADAEHCRLLCCRLTQQGTRQVEEIKGDLMRLAAGQLAEHPMVGRLVPAAPER